MAIVATLEVWDGAAWVEIPMRVFEVKETDRNPVTELRCEIVSSPSTTAEWVSPTGFTASAWTNEENAYDGNTTTFAFRSAPHDIWTEYLILTHGGLLCDAIRVFANVVGTAITSKQISIDVYYGDTWHNIYEGVVTAGDWVTYPLSSSKNVTSVRMRLKGDALLSSARVYEVAFRYTGDKRALLTFNRQIKFTHEVDGDDFSFLGRIAAKPETLIGPDMDILNVVCYDETAAAQQVRFVDSYPKSGIETYSEIIEDAWTRYGPAGTTFTGLGVNSAKPDFIASPMETLFNFMEEICFRTGWRWKLVDGDLQFYDPYASHVSAIPVTESSIRAGSVIEGGKPEIANVIFIPALLLVEDFEDEQTTVTNRAQYFLQYSPLAKPVIVVNGTPVTPGDILPDDDFNAASAVVVYSAANHFIRFATGSIPAGSLALVVTYDANLSVLVERRDPVSVALYGEIQQVIQRVPRPSKAEAIELGDAYLTEHALPVSTIEAGMLEKRTRCGWYHQVTFKDYDQLMPCVATNRRGDTAGRYTVTATFSRAPVTDAEMIFDLFRRLQRLESKETAQEERLERFLDITDTWLWSDSISHYWSDTEWLSEQSHGLKHLAQYVLEQAGGRKVYPS